MKIRGDVMNETEKGFLTPYRDFIRNRITELRLHADISEYQMSLDLGQNKSYIQSISSGRALPSMNGFLNICDYFNITPLEFFDADIKNPCLMREINNKLKKFSEKDLIMINSVLERILGK